MVSTNQKPKLGNKAENIIMIFQKCMRYLCP